MFQNSVIHALNLTKYEFAIPKGYFEQIERGELNAVAVYEGEVTDECFYGAYVTAVHAGWLELVWIYLPEERRHASAEAELLRYCMVREQQKRNFELEGAFFEIHEEEVTQHLKDALALAGMEVWEEQGNVYEFAVKDVAERARLIRAARLANIKTLAEAEPELLEQVEEVFQTEERPVPIDSFVDWEEYVPEISMICIQEDRPTGVLLFTRAGKYLVLELAYTTTKNALALMLGRALSVVQEQYSEDQRILAPIAVKRSREILEKLVPDGTRSGLLEALKWFEPPRETTLIRELYATTEE